MEPRRNAGLIARRTILSLAALAVIAFVPSFVGEFRAFELTYVGIFAIALLGLNILTGYAGQISLGHGAFLAIGGYASVILTVNAGVPQLWTIPLAGLAAGVIGFAFGFPALRLAGVYLALATFALAVAVPSIAKYEKLEPYTGGGGGVVLDLPTTPFGLPLSPSDWLYYVTWGIAAGLFACAWLLLRGRTGRAWRSLRDSEIAAVSSGVDLARFKTLAFGVSAFYGGIAGALYAILIGFINPDTFPVSLSILLLTGAVVGGITSLTGVVIGALFVQYIGFGGYGRDALDWVLDLVGADVDTTATGVPAVVYGAILLAVLLIAPLGIAGVLQRLRSLTMRVYSRLIPVGEPATSRRSHP